MSGGRRAGSWKRIAAALAVATLVVLAGCSGAGSGGDAARPEGVDSGGGGAAGAEPAETEVGNVEGDDGALQIQQRRVVRTGRVVLTVDDYGRARANLTAAVEGMGGFVSDSTRRRHEVTGGTYVTGSVTLRVPTDRFGTMMDRASSMGTVEHSETSETDVTEQLVDIEARLSNLRAERDRLRTLYDRANDTEDVLAVQRRLADTQERIERLEARQRALERRVAYATIEVQLREEPPTAGPEAVQQWYDVPLVGAFLESVHGVTVAVRALAVVVAYALPYLLAFGLPPLLVAGVAYRRWWGDGDGGDGGDPEESADESNGERGERGERSDGTDEPADGDDDAGDGETGVAESGDSGGDATADREGVEDGSDEAGGVAGDDGDMEGVDGDADGTDGDREDDADR